MNLPSSQFLQLVEPLTTTVSSPKLDLIVLAWDHIATRYLRRLDSNRVLSGRVRSIRLLAVHDAVQAVIDPGNGYIYKEISTGSTIEAAAAAVIQASHDFLASIFTSSEDRTDLADLREESLGLIHKQLEKAAGISSGSESAAVYTKTFAPLLLNHREARKPHTEYAGQFSASGRSWGGDWRRSA